MGGQITHLTVAQAFQNAVARSGYSVKAQYFFFANGEQLGSFGQLTSSDGSFKANFDTNYTAISANYPASVPSQYIVQTGDTLKVIAAKVFGDASLWYLIADDNGLTDPDAVLDAGTQLRIPNDVVSLKNDATSFKPFNVQEALGDTTPTQPVPPPPHQGKHGCGVIGMIIVIVVAIIVTIWTAGAAAGGASAAVTTAGGGTAAAGSTFAAGTAALSGSLAAGTGASIAAAAIGGAVGSIVSQGVGLAIGQQDGFSWQGVALGAIGAGVTAGVGSSGLFSGLNGYESMAASAATGNALTQGIGVLTGLQKSFSWRDVAISAAAAPIAKSVGGAAASEFNSAFIGNFAGGITGSLVRAAFGGKIDAQSVLVDAFDNAIGNSIVEASQPKTKQPYQQLAEDIDAESQQSLDAWAQQGLDEMANRVPTLSVNPETDFSPGMVSGDQVRERKFNWLTDPLPNIGLTSGIGIDASDTVISVSTGAKAVNPQAALKSLGVISPTAEKERLELARRGIDIKFGADAGSFYSAGDKTIYLDSSLQFSEKAIQRTLAHEIGHVLDRSQASVAAFTDRETYLREALADEGLAEINREVIRRETVSSLGGNGAFDPTFTDAKSMSLLGKGVHAFVKAGGIDSTVEAAAKDVGTLFRQLSPSTNAGLTYEQYYGAGFDVYRETGSFRYQARVQERWNQISMMNQLDQKLQIDVQKQVDQIRNTIKPPQVKY